MRKQQKHYFSPHTLTHSVLSVILQESITFNWAEIILFNLRPWKPSFKDKCSNGIKINNMVLLSFPFIWFIYYIFDVFVSESKETKPWLWKKFKKNTHTVSLLFNLIQLSNESSDDLKGSISPPNLGARTVENWLWPTLAKTLSLHCQSW